MAGGQGSRLRPLTSNQPKPMLPIVGQPMMQHILRLLRRHGATDVVATVQFLASIIRNFFGDGSDLGISLSYATEEEPLGTAGSVKNAEAFLDDTFLVISGDALTDLDLSAAIAFHREREAAVTVVTKRVEDPLEFGIVIAEEDGRIDRFLEKPGWGEVFSDTINTGVYVIEPEVLGFIPSSEEFDFAADLFPLLLDKGLPMYAYRSEDYWTDVGNLDSYMQAHRDVLDGRVEVEIEGFELSEGVWLGEGAEIDPAANIVGPAYVGENSRVEGGATIREYTALGSNVVVKGGAFVHRAVVHDNAYVGPGASLRGCVVGKNTDIKSNARLEEGVVVADECYVGDGAVLNPQVKVYPFKSVDSGALVTQSIIWESRGSRSLFGERGVAGLMNIDVTPEMALRLALAFGSTLPKTSVVTACRDVTRTARIVKRAMIAGFNAAGVNCHDLELVPTPVARHYARSTRAVAGVVVRTAPDDASAVEIQFFDERGVDIDASMQRKVERTFYRDDFRRAYHHEIGELTFPARGREYYTRGLTDAVNLDAIRDRGPKLVVDYSFGAANLTAPPILGRAGADVLAVNAALDEDRVVMDQADVENHLLALSGMVRTSGADLGVLIDATAERIPTGRRPGAAPRWDRRPAGVRSPGHPGPRRAPDRGPGHGDPAGPGARGRRRGRGPVDQGHAFGPDGRGRRGRGRLRGRRGGRLHLPRLPGRVRRGPQPGEAAGVPGGGGHAAVRGGRRAPVRPHGGDRRPVAVGGEGDRDAPAPGARGGRRPGRHRRGEDLPRRGLDPGAPGSRRAAGAGAGRGGLRGGGRFAGR